MCVNASIKYKCFLKLFINAKRGKALKEGRDEVELSIMAGLLYVFGSYLIMYGRNMSRAIEMVTP